jgi:regulator of sirC expression with transglutaminase-like and TPR domain
LEWAAALHRVLGVGHGFHGTPGDYQRLSSSLLQDVLRRRRGLPILLSVVWIEVARRAGAPVYGVALPGHFAVGLGDPDGEHVLVDPFDGGRLMSRADAQLLAEGAESFSPADPLDVVQRILNNIRAWAAPRPEHRPVQLWTLDLTLLLPRHPAKLRYERAKLLVSMGDFLGGAAEMDSYADVIGTFDPESAAAIRLGARAARAHLN